MNFSFDLYAQTSKVYKGDFVISNSIIPTDEILSGGVPRDGIPAILSPTFLDNSNLGNDEQILGLSLNGVQKAYPVKILNFHEAVNDRFVDQPILITFCPLCGSGVGFISTVEGENLTFGISGLLYNSDVLLYDHQTKSLWSQLMSKSISGDFSGKSLDAVSLTHTTWGEWKKRYPGSVVLSENTGHARNYNTSPYEGYLAQDRLMFSVKNQNKTLKNKALVLGVQVGNTFKAYPFSELNTASVTKDVINGQELEIHYDQVSNNAWVDDRFLDKLQATRLFWFAWYAFHPDTEVFRSK